MAAQENKGSTKVGHAGERVIEGFLVGEGRRFGIVAGRFNSLVARRLVDGAIDALRRHGVSTKDIDVAWVPGAFDLPLVAKRMAGSKKYDAVVAIGAVIRGGTPHFDYVSNEVTRGVAEAGWQHDIPVAFGILTTDNVEQAIDRAGLKSGNKGSEAALAALEMANLMDTLDKIS